MVVFRESPRMGEEFPGIALIRRGLTRSSLCVNKEVFGTRYFGGSEVIFRWEKASTPDYRDSSTHGVKSLQEAALKGQEVVLGVVVRRSW